MNEIRQIRQSLGISQRELANLLSIPKSAISMAESGQRPLPEEVLTYLRFMAANKMPVQELHPAIEEEMERRREEFDNQLKDAYREKMARIEVQISNLDKEIAIQETISVQIQAKLFLIGEELSATLKGSRQYGIIFSEINRLLDVHYKPNQLYHQLLEVKRDSLKMELEGYRAVLGE